MSERPVILTEKQLAELVTGAMCRMANGSPACDPEHCVCGEEGRQVARDLYAQGYRVHIIVDALVDGQSAEK